VEIATYALDDNTRVKFEIDPEPGFSPASPDQVLGKVQRAIEPLVETAKAVLDKVKEARPDQVEVKFGVKVTGGADWIVARAAGEGNFEIKLTWSRDEHKVGTGAHER
jgi:Trypsin-co-occurring domain 1